MKLRKLILAGAAMLPMMVAARPADPAVLKIHQPDGSVVEARLHGDEHFSFITTPDNKTILEYSASGVLQPAMRNGNILSATRANLEMLRAEEASTPAGIAAQAVQAVQHRMAALETSGQTTYNTIGEVHMPVLLVEFSDRKFTVPEPHKLFDRLLNEEGFNEYNAKGSASDFYQASSRGLFKPIFDVYGPVSVSQTASYYVAAGSGQPGEGKYGYFAKLLEEAVPKADKDYNIDFSKYDLDGDGLIDNIYIYYAGHSQADTGRKDCIWPHQGDYRTRTTEYGGTIAKPVVVDGVKLATYATSNELLGSAPSQPYLDGIGAFCHEFGHVIGLPDMYDVYEPLTCKTPGYYDLMDQGSYNDSSTRPPMLNAYERWVCKWVEAIDLKQQDTDIKCVIEATTPTGPEKVYRLRVPAPGNRLAAESYFVEARDYQASKWDWDRFFPGGIMLWRVNFDRGIWVNNQVNSLDRPYVEIIAPDWNTDDIFWPGRENEVNNIYPGGPNQLLPIRLAGSTYNVFLTDIRYDHDNQQGTFDFNVITELPNITTVLSNDVQIQRYTNGNFDLTFNWEDVAEAEDYLLTVKRVLSNGSEAVYGGLEDYSVGKTTSYTLNRVLSSNFNTEFIVSVRCKKQLPAAKTSNELRFKPSELGTGVAEIANDGSVYTLGNSIYAPAGAKIYDIQGLETTGENLPKGLYIVVYNGKSKKVAIK